MPLEHRYVVRRAEQGLRVDEVVRAPDHQVVGREQPLRDVVDVLVVVEVVQAGHPHNVAKPGMPAHVFHLTNTLINIKYQECTTHNTQSVNIFEIKSTIIFTYSITINGGT